MRQRRGKELIDCCTFPSEHYRGCPKTRILARTQDSLKEAPRAVEADIERYMAEGLAIDKAEDALYGENGTGRSRRWVDISLLSAQHRIVLHKHKKMT